MKKILKILTISLFASFITGGLVACGGTSGTSQTSSNNIISVESVSLTVNQEYVKIGESLQLTTTVLPSNASDKSVTYSSNNDNITISDLGVVTGIKQGESVVTVTTNDGSKTDQLTITVVPAGEHSYLTINQLGDVLSESPYSVNDLTTKDKYGLSSPNNVGVNSELIVEKYKIKDDSEFLSDAIFEINKISLEQVKTYFPEAQELTDYNKIQTAIYLAKEINLKGREAKIKFPSGNLILDGFTGTQALIIDGLNGTYFEGNNTTLIVNTDSLIWKGYISVNNSQNIYFNGLTFELSTPSSISGTFVDADIENREIEIQINHEYDDAIELLKENKLNPRSWVEYDYNTKVPLQNGNFVVDGFESYEILGDRNSNYTLKMKFKNPINRSRNGTFVSIQFSQYDAVGFTVNNSQNIYLENLTMHNAAGMALTASNVTNFYVNRFNLTLKTDSTTFMTATADAMHFNEMHGDCFVSNCLIENSHDDALNIKHGYWYKLTDALGGSTKQMTVARITSDIGMPKVGDKVAVYNEETFEGHNPSNGYYTIKEISKTANGFQFTVNERMSNTGEWGNCRVTFFSDTPNFVYSNNIIRNKRNRGILVQVPNATIENNAFINVGHGSIQAASAMDIYNESTLPQNLTIKNNKFINNAYLKEGTLLGDISIFAIANNSTVAPKGTLTNMNIENNFITQNGNAAVSLRGVGDSTLKDNLFYECSRTQPSGDTANAIIHGYNVGNITLEGNYNQYTLDGGAAGINLQGMATSEDFNLTGNYNIDFKQNEDAGPEVEISKASNSITIDGKLDEWQNNNATVIEIDGISDAEGNERTADELKSHFSVNQLLMTYDDNGIYIAFDVFDDKLDVKTINDFWLGDCVEIFMTDITNMPTADMQVYRNDGGVMQLALAPTWESNNYVTFGASRTNDKYIDHKDLIKAKFETNTTGYTGELLIPFTLAPEYKEAIDSGKAIDMAIVIADSERLDQGLKRVQAANVPHFVEDYKTKSERMPQYYFK